MKRVRIRVSGQVQGVGFRPFVYREATRLGLFGHVGNTAQGVEIEAHGPQGAVDELLRCLHENPPPLACITGLVLEPLDITAGPDLFRILESRDGSGHNVLISPDVGTCDQCCNELFDPHDRRYLYPFINCTDCGPRLTITLRIPYDREQTSMACFPLCPDCAREYADPMDRRFHAEPVACPVCGPQVWLTDSTGSESAPPNTALQQAAHALAAGKILALKGLGGFHLACDARNEDAIALLRQRKHRPHKALAVMVANADDLAPLAAVSEAETALLRSPARPIVLLQPKPEALPRSIAPDTDTVGCMLAYTPLHLVLLHHCRALGVTALVMTSGNPPGEPLCLGNREALHRLSGHADLFLLHNRDILIRADDSVVRVIDAGNGPQPLFIRRSRGYTPSPLPLPVSGPSLLATGADLKAAPCLTRNHDAFVSQYIGDLENPAVTDFYQSATEHLSRLLDVQPAAVVTDLHPGYHAGHVAENYAAEHELPLHRVQHHEAHAHAVLGEHGHAGPALALMLDGTGYGPDGTIWGGELLLVMPGAPAQRLGRLKPFPLPGGDRAVREPWRVAAGLCSTLGLPIPAHLASVPEAAPILPALLEAVRANVFPLTSSCGRLFDAVSAALGLCPVISYEGQAAIRLESVQDCSINKKLPAPVHETDGLWELDSGALFAEALEEKRVPVAARKFHLGLVQGFTDMAVRAAERHNVRTIALGGGVLQNRTIAETLPRVLRAAGMTPLLPVTLPPGDGAISYGQAVWFIRSGNCIL